jgi:branched-subunit amino acid transport protein AzlD
MGGVIFFCRVFPFFFFRSGDDVEGKGQDVEGSRSSARREALLAFVEKVAPPVAMTVLTFNALAGPVKGNLREGIPVLCAAVFAALAYLWKRNPLISIFGGTAVYMILERIIMR